MYLAIKSSQGQSVVFITSKTMVPPMKPQTIPRLELLTALLLVRLMEGVTNSFSSELTLNESTCYTDSKA